MVKVNDKVYHVYNLSLKGVVVGIQQEKARAWMVGGASQGKFVANVQMQDGRVVSVPAEDLMRED
jgi:hypothetical protein